MFHRGEVVEHRVGPEGDWEPLTVVTGWCDWPVVRMVFATQPGEPPWRYERHHPPGVLAVLQRRSDGKRFLLDAGTLELREQAEGGLKHFDHYREEEVRSQFDDAARGVGGTVARRAISVGGRTLREPPPRD